MHMFTYAWSKKERWTADTPKLPKSGHDQISESGGKWLRSELVLCTKAGEGRAEKEFHKGDEVSQSVLFFLWRRICHRRKIGDHVWFGHFGVTTYETTSVRPVCFSLMSRVVGCAYLNENIEIRISHMN